MLLGIEEIMFWIGCFLMLFKSGGLATLGSIMFLSSFLLVALLAFSSKEKWHCKQCGTSNNDYDIQA